MNQYDGLNLVDLLALLNEIVPPQPVSLLPQTPGWWIAAAWLLAVLTCLGTALIRHRRMNRYRREAVAELERIEAGPDDSEATADVALLLKRTALVAYPRDQVASLYGADWARFLVETVDGDAEVSKAADLLAQAAYRDGVSVAQIAPAAQRWIRRHRV